jgi:hypothetical protein
MVQIPVGFNAQDFEEIIRQRVEQVLLQALEILAEECRKNVPIDTGELRDSIHIEGPWRASPFYIEGRVVAGGPNIPQAYFQEFGTPPHGPKQARAMHFFWKGEEIFTRFVSGCRPLFWMRNSLNFSLPKIQGLFKLLEAESKGFIFTVTTVGPNAPEVPYYFSKQEFQELAARIRIGL